MSVAGRFDLHPFDARSVDAVVSTWNAACGPALTVSRPLVEYNTRSSTGARQVGQIAVQEGQPVGFALASAMLDDPVASPTEIGWVDAIAVLPAAQRQGIGTALLAWAEEWLRTTGCSMCRLGGSLRPFAPGYPVELGGEGFFHRRGYTRPAEGAETWDVARSLSDYTSWYPERHGQRLVVRPARPGDASSLRAFLLREFPNRWRYEFEEFVREQGRLSDYQILESDRGIDGFARLTFEDSITPIERFNMEGLDRPWGQLGPIGISADSRGRGYGGLLLDASLVRLRDSGVKGCVIDWTRLVGFYGKFGFQPYRRYAILLKELVVPE